MEAWEKVLADDKDFAASVHGQVGCVLCHGGNDSEVEMNEAGMQVAHQGVIADPSNLTCYSCHKEIAEKADDNFHQTLSGMKGALMVRGGDMSEGSVVAEAFENHCNTCHTTCGQCHVSIPTQAGGGLTSGHEFKSPPLMKDNCVTCHGARAGNEFLGVYEGIPKDVHRMKGMQCKSCHGEEIHYSSGAEMETRYDSAQAASCDDSGCHDDVWTTREDNPYHAQHLDDLSCYVCHSVEYKNCYSCHAEINEEGEPVFTTEPAKMDFKIGLNPIQSEERSSKYVVLRHVPTNAHVFDYYGENLLPEFDNLPTWKYATPHNIQLNTPQTESCDSCHGNVELFLTAEDVPEGEMDANRGVIVEEIPDPNW
ncbi:MAG: hypothetical protein R6U37_07795 [Dehalococcoidia bacterium]